MNLAITNFDVRNLASLLQPSQTFIAAWEGYVDQMRRYSQDCARQTEADREFAEKRAKAVARLQKERKGEQEKTVRFMTEFVSVHPGVIEPSAIVKPPTPTVAPETQATDTDARNAKSDIPPTPVEQPTNSPPPPAVASNLPAAPMSSVSGSGKCPQCGAQVGKTARQCGVCGMSLTTPTTMSREDLIRAGGANDTRRVVNTLIL